jgi:Fe-S-cluster-containing dehydrogenase component/anaerobic selenocysteine-containing dehydrogenase
MKKKHNINDFSTSAVPINKGKEDGVPNAHMIELFEEDFLKLNSSRRDFLKVFGFSFASAAIIESCKRPVIKAIPYVIQPPEVVPGKALYYATSFFDGHEYAGIVVKTRDGRPVKIEGNSMSAFNGEGTTARVQASVLSLYDDARMKAPLINQKSSTWDKIDFQIIDNLKKINAKDGEIVLLSSTIISPSTIKVIKEFGAGFKKFRWVQYDPISHSAIREANLLCFGEKAIPDYNFQKASLVVSVNADFLGTWVAPVHFIPRYTAQRKLNNGKKEMLRHIHFESGMSLTGSNADLRIKIRQSEEREVLTDLYNRIALKTGEQIIPGSNFREDLTSLSESLLAAKGKSIVISGSNDVDIQIIVNGINSLLGNYVDCIDLNNCLNLAAGSDKDMKALVDDLNDGKIRALLMYNVNPVYDYPSSEKILKGINSTELTVNMAGARNETTGLAKFECPVHHFLESWDDAEIIQGQLSLSQPCINPLFETRSFQDSLLKWSGNPVSWHEFLMQNWEKEFFPKSDQKDFRNFWNVCLGNGIFSYNPLVKKTFLFDKKIIDRFPEISANINAEGYEVIVGESVALGTGMHCNNPWLMELPDPISRLCWENVAAVSPSDALKLGIVTGHILRLGKELSIPAFVQPGQAEGTISIALGYGHKNSGRVANNAGVNLYPFVSYAGGTRSYVYTIDKIENTLIESPLALTQTHSSMEGRPIVRDTLLSKYKENPISGNELHEVFESQHKTLYPDVKYEAFNWAIAIDLNSCIGCNSCVIACQAENNIPVVGKEEVKRRRIMHWIKIDRYYSESENNPRVYFQPIMCQHCDNAPCENVCPVSATNHNSEGLNQVAYNRCVGTKYCINNCPYKVRRFNWYRYTNNKEFNFHTVSDLGKMVLNPDVTVRERGVVEKCSFCVQRIQEKKLQAKLENRILADNEIKTACMQACPASAIVFGNLNDDKSIVAELFRNPRRYHLLEELHTLPSVGFLTKVWNDEEIKS